MSEEKILQDIEAFNKDVSKWAYKVRGRLKRNLAQFQNGRGAMRRFLKTSLRKDQGEIDSISYKFPRHGVFAQKGVGRGHVMQNGKVVRGVKDDTVIRFSSKKHGKVGYPFAPATKSRQPEDWFNAEMDQQVPLLADIVADHKADEAAVNAGGMRIR